MSGVLWENRKNEQHLILQKRGRLSEGSTKKREVFKRKYKLI